MACFFYSALLILACFCLSAQMPNQFIEYEKEIRSRNNQIVFTKNVLKVYRGFSLIFHVENSTVDKIEYLLKILHDDMFGEIVILNHDSAQFGKFRNRNGFPFLHVIILEDGDKLKNYLNCTKCLIYKDVVIFIILKQFKSDEPPWLMPKLDWAGNVVIINITKLPISLYNVCYYCGERNGQLNLLQRSNLTKIKVDVKEILPRTFANFNLTRFHVGYINSFPFMLCVGSKIGKIGKDQFKICDEAYGFEVRALETISKTNNFTYWLHEHDYALNEADLDINKYDKAPLDFLIGGLSMTAARAPKISFTSPLTLEPYTFVYIPKEVFFSKILDNAKPFSLLVWIIVFCSSLAISICLYLCERLLEDRVSISRCFKICFKSIVEQTEYVKMKKHVTVSYIIVLWWLSSMIILASYKSKLFSISIRKYHVEPSNLRELLENDYEIVMDSQSTDILEDIYSNNESLVMQARKKLVLKNNTCNAISYVINERAAMLDEYSTIQYHSLAMCSNILKNDVYSKLRITRDPFRHTTHSWPLRMGAPYKHAFNRVLIRIDAAGLIPKWKSDALAILQNQYNNIPLSQTLDMTQEVGFLSSFFSVFVLYIGGHVLSIIVFMIEVGYYWCTH